MEPEMTEHLGHEKSSSVENGAGKPSLVESWLIVYLRRLNGVVQHEIYFLEAAQGSRCRSQGDLKKVLLAHFIMGNIFLCFV
jgi:hypothetical protein